MGSNLGHLYDWKELEELREETNLPVKELQALRQRFLHLSKHGAGISRTLFRDLLGQDNWADAAVFDHLFTVFDTNKDGTVDLREFIVGLSIFAKGAAKDRLRSIFDLYDLDGSGTISKEELITVLMVMQETLKGSIGKESKSKSKHHNVAPKRPSENEVMELRKWVDTFFKEFDLDHNEQLDFEEFRRAIHWTPVLKTASEAAILRIMGA